MCMCEQLLLLCTVPLSPLPPFFSSSSLPPSLPLLFSQVTCTSSSSNGLCEASVGLPTVWFTAIQEPALVSVDIRLVRSPNPPEVIGTVTIQPQPSLSLSNDVALVIPSRPISPIQLFSVPVYAHTTYPVATFSLACGVNSDELSIEGLSFLNGDKWTNETRHPGPEEIGVVAVLSDPESVEASLVSVPELLFSIHIRVRAGATGNAATINCTTFYLSNLLNEKVQPGGQVTPTPTAVIDLNPINSPFVGEVVIDRAVPRGLLSYADQAQVVNTAVFSQEEISVPLQHAVVMSDGSLLPTDDIHCTSSSPAFELSSDCTNIFLTSDATSGTELDTVYVTSGNLSTSLTFRVWFPYLGASLEATPSSLHPIASYEVGNMSGSCSQKFQEAKIEAFASFSYSATSPVFEASVIDLLYAHIVISDSGILELSENGTLQALSVGSAEVSVTSSLVSLVVVTVMDDAVPVSTLDVTLFSGLTLTSTPSPFPAASSQLASVSLDHEFTIIGSVALAAITAVLPDGSVIPVTQEMGLVLTSLNSSVLEVVQGEIVLLSRGSGPLVLAEWYSPCSNALIAAGTGAITVDIPDPTGLQVDLASSRVTVPGDTAVFAGIPTSVAITTTLLYPDGQVKDATSDPRLEFDLSNAQGLITISDSQPLIAVSGQGFGVAVVAVRYFGFSVSAELNISVVGYAGLEIHARPFPPYQGSEEVEKLVLSKYLGTDQFQKVDLELDVVLSDNSTVSVTQSSRFNTSSGFVLLVANIAEATGAGTFQIDGEFEGDVITLDLESVEDTPVTISDLLNLSIGTETLSGVKDFKTPLFLDAQFSDGTVYPNLIPEAGNLFPSLIMLFSDNPTIASVSSFTGQVTLLRNHHSLVTITAYASESIATEQFEFACNLEPAVGDVDLGENAGVPLPAADVGSVLSVPVYVQAGSFQLSSFELHLVYNTMDNDILVFEDILESTSWKGSISYNSVPSVGLLTISGSSGEVSGLVHVATITFSAVKAGVGGMGGVVTQMKDSSSTTIGLATPRDMVAGEVSVLVMPPGSTVMRRSQDESRTPRSAPCAPPFPCETCPNSRELGDANGDCIFDVADPEFLLQYFAEEMFSFRLDTGQALLSSITPFQEAEFDADRNTDTDLADAYFLFRVEKKLIHFLKGVLVLPVVDNPLCTLAVNATILESRGTIPDPNATAIFFDFALPFDSTFVTQQLFENSVFQKGGLVMGVDKGLALQGGIAYAQHLEGGVYGVEMSTNFSAKGVGLSVIQATLGTSQIAVHPSRTLAMFASQDPPFSVPGSLQVDLPVFSRSATLVSSGYNPLTTFDNTVASSLCASPPPPPSFAQSLYSVLLPESAPPGTTVLVAEAATNPTNSTLTYSILAGADVSGVFSVGGGNGVVTVVSFLDYEEVVSYRFQLQVLDESTGQFDTAMVDIEITDVNDNFPLVEPLDAISVPVNFPVGGVVAMVNASDVDSGQNGRLMYSLAENSSPFSINRELGVVFLESPLVSDVASHEVTIVVSDMGPIPLSSNVTLNISVTPSDPRVLQFNQSFLNLSLPENTTVGETLANLPATSVSSMNLTILYSLNPENLPFNISSRGELMLMESLDFESTSSYVVQVMAVVEGVEAAMTALAIVSVQVQDINDNFPIFTLEHYTGSLEENAPLGTLDLVVTATDLDAGENGRIRYSLVEETPFFVINETSGVLTNTESLDHESIQEVRLAVQAADYGSPSLTSYANVTISVADVNDNSPNISFSLTYTPPLSESTATGFIVAQTTIVDADSPSTNGELLLTLVSDSPEFAINASTGDVILVQPLDYEAQQNHTLVLRASDSGSPPLTSEVSLVILVEDANDNSPVFTQSTYSLSIPESTPVGSSLLQLEATDQDSDLNGVVLFFLLSVEYESLFDLSETGLLLVNESLDYETDTSFLLEVEASNPADGAPPALANVSIAVEDVNEFPPVFQPSATYVVSVPEGGNGSILVASVMTTDMDSTTNVSYTLVGNNGENFVISPSSGQIFTTQPLDRESIPFYSLSVSARDDIIDPAMTSNATVEVHVLDVNDNSPSFQTLGNLTVSEATPVGEILLTFEAVDLDAGLNGNVVFFLENPITEFSLSSTGELNLTSPLNASLYSLTVVAQDLGTPPMKTVLELSVTVALSTVPIFDMQVYSISVVENNSPGSFLLQVQASSRDPAASNITYVFITPTTAFEVDPVNGSVTASVSLDREDRDLYSITVEARTLVNTSSTAVIEVSVLDENDNPPSFNVSEVLISVRETVTAGSIFFYLPAFDADKEINAMILYNLASNDSEAEALFSVDTAGNILTTQSLLGEFGTYNLTLQASNLASVGALSSTVDLSVVVEHVNDFTPQFASNYSLSVSEDAAMGLVLAVVQAKDSDVGSASVVSYAIIEGESIAFSLNSSTGELSLERTLDYENRTQYVLVVIATDGGIPTKSSMVSVAIEVRDINDNPPVFSQMTYIGNISENLPPEQSILTIEVGDSDSPANSQIDLFLLGDPVDFSIDTSGVLYSTVSYDREAVGSYSLTVVAINNGSGVVLSSNATIEVTILDQNDEAPTFDQDAYFVVLQAPLEPSIFVVLVSANDGDLGSAGQVVYSLAAEVSNSSSFAIDNSTGVVTVESEITVEADIALFVVASDLGSPAMSTQVPLNITVLPPVDLSSGRETDLTFSSDLGAFFIGPPSSDGVNAYSQSFGLLGSPADRAHGLSAALGSLSDSVTVFSSLSVASAVRAISLLSAEIWPDDPVLRLAAQVQDDSHNVQTLPTTVTVKAVSSSLSMEVEGSCSPDSTSGSCIAGVQIPSGWFQSGETLSVQYGLPAQSLTTLSETVQLREKPVFSVNADASVFMEMPLRPLFPGDMFTVPVYGDAESSSAVGSYTVRVQSTDAEQASLVELLADSSVWLAQTMSGSDGSITITAVRSDQEAVPIDERVELFSLTAQVSSEASTDRFHPQVLSADVLFMGDSNLGQILPPANEESVKAYALSRNGVTLSGGLYIAEDALLSLLPYAAQAELVNTALLDASTVTSSLTVLAVFPSGTLNKIVGASCSSEDPTVLQVSSNCDSVYLTTNQTQASTDAVVSLSYGGLAASIPFLIWVPTSPLVIVPVSSTTTVLYRVPLWFNSSESCSPLYQRSSLGVYCSLTNSEDSIDSLDVTDLVSDRLSASNSAVLSIEGVAVRGVSEGVAEVVLLSPAPGLLTGSVQFNVTSSPVEVLGLDVQVLTSLALHAPSSVSPPPSSNAQLSVSVDQLFDFEGIEGSVLISAVFEDGSRMPLTLGDGLSVVSLNENVIKVSGDVVTAVGSGQGHLVEAIWLSNGTCDSPGVGGFIAMETAEVTVSLPSPTRIEVSPQNVLLASPDTAASLIGIPTSTVLSVVAVFPDDRRQDLTADSRTVFLLPDGVAISESGSSGSVLLTVEPDTTSGMASIEITFQQFPEFSELLNFTVVSVEDVSVAATPFPTYPGSESMSVTTIQPISETGQWQMLLLSFSAVLSDTDERRDISFSPHLELTVEYSSGSLESATTLSLENILSVSAAETLTGSIIVSASVEDVLSLSPLHVSVTNSPVEVSAIAVNEFPNGDFIGLAGEATHQVVITVDFSDGTRYIDLFSGGFTLPNLVNFSSNPSSAMTVNETTGLATLQGNSLEPATVTVTSVESNVQSSVAVACNLEPAFGDVDLGLPTGLPVPQQVVGDTFTIAVRLNSGTKSLDSLELDIFFNESVIRAVGVTPGASWPSSGLFQFNINDPVDTVTVGGIVDSSVELQGTALHIADIEFMAVSTGVSRITGVTRTLAEPSSGGLDGTSQNIIDVPADFISGDIQVRVVSGERKRSALPTHTQEEVKPSHPRVARQSCSLPPCDACDPPRETGDVDGNCIFDVRDVSYLQLYYLTLVTSAETVPSLPPEREEFLDIDLSGTVDPNDVVFMLRVNFRLLRFVTDLAVLPVTEENCELLVRMVLLEGGDLLVSSVSTAMVVDFAHSEPEFQQAFDDLNFTVGSVLVTDKGMGLYGGLVLAESDPEHGTFVVSAQTNNFLPAFGISLIQVTFDDLMETSPTRTAAMFSQGSPLYQPLNVTISLRGNNVGVRSSQNGYAPLVLATPNTLTSDECQLRMMELHFELPLYTESVPEDAEPGHLVLSVQATSFQPGAQIVYALNSSESNVPFSLNDSTGDLLLLERVDYDNGQRGYFFTVAASEDGGVSFTATAGVNISILNVNDLPPVVEAEKSIDVPTSAVGEVAVIVASDPDGLDNLTYTLESASEENLFEVNATGSVLVVGVPASNPNILVNLTICVSDGKFSEVTKLFLFVFQTDFAQELYDAAVSELAPVDTPVVHLSLEFNLQLRVFQYDIFSPVPPFYVNSSGFVFVEGMLDRESVGMYQFEVIGRDSDGSITTEVRVEVTDENDNAPMFDSDIFFIQVPMDTLVGTRLPLVNFGVTDRDTGINEEVSYSLSDTSLLSINQTTGQLIVEQSLFSVTSSFNLTVSVTDSGDPPLSSVAVLVVEVTPTNISAYPLPPTFSVTNGAFLLAQAKQTDQQSFSQRAGVFPFDASSAGQVTASHGNVSADFSLSLTPQRASTLNLSLLHPNPSNAELYFGDREVVLAAQVRDEDHRTTTIPETLSITATLVDSPDTATASCTTDALYGLCRISVIIPDSWFGDSTRSVIVELDPEPFLQFSSSMTTYFFTLQARPQSPGIPDQTNQILVDLPHYDVFPGDSFEVAIYGFATHSISSFSLTFSIDASLAVEELLIDSTTWSSRSVSNSDTFAVSAILSKPHSLLTLAAASEPVLLCSLRITAEASLQASRDANITAQVSTLATVLEGSVPVGESRVSSEGPVLFRGREGTGAVGTIHIVPDAIVALFPWTPQPELLNTAVFNSSGESAVSAVVTLFVGRLSGELVPYDGQAAECLSRDPSVLQVDPSCSSILLAGNETTGSQEVGVEVRVSSIASILPVRVFFPDPSNLLLTVSDYVLNRVSYFSGDGNCSSTYQQASVFAEANFSAGERRIEGVVVTDSVAVRLVSTDPTVLSVAVGSGGRGGVVKGVGPGSAKVCLGSYCSGSVMVLADQVVQLVGLGVSVVAGLELTGSNTVSPQPGDSSTEIVVGLRSRFEFERERGTVLVAVLYSDGSAAPVEDSDVTLTSPSSSSQSVYDIQGKEVVALTSGQTQLLVAWSTSEASCDVSAMATVPISVALPEPIGVIVNNNDTNNTLHLLTVPGDPANTTAGIPLSRSLQVLLLYPGGRTLDLTSDPRTMYSLSNDLIEVNQELGIVTAMEGVGAGGGVTEVSITFSHTPLQASLQYEVVLAIDSMIARVLPFPPYPGSETVELTSLLSIEDTGVYQEAQVQLVLNTSREEIDVSLQATVIPGGDCTVSETNVLTVMSPGKCMLLVGLEGVSTSLSIAAEDPDELVLTVDSIGIQSLESDTLSGIPGPQSAELSLNLNFSNGHQYSNRINDTVAFLPDLLELDTTSTAIAINSSTGHIQLQENSHTPVSLQVIAGSVSANTSFYVNLDPDVGDVDFGGPKGPPIPTAVVGDPPFLVPVCVNTGASLLGSVDLLLSYDPAVLRLHSVEPGSDWVGGVYEASLNDPLGEVRFGGYLTSGEVRGKRVNIFSLVFSAEAAASETSLSGTILSIAEDSIDGTPIGPPTPRPIIAGNLSFSVEPSRRRSAFSPAPATKALEKKSLKRSVAEECASVPCNCSGMGLGDADGNCVFDVRDASYTFLYLAESLLGFSSPQGQSILNRTLAAQVEQMDANGDGRVDTDDVYYLLRTLFSLIYFVDGLSVVPVQDTASQCLLSIQVSLSTGQPEFDVKTVSVFVDLSSQNSSVQGGFVSSTAVQGRLLTVEKGPGHVGGVYEAERVSNTLFIVRLNSTFVTPDLGVSVILASFDGLNSSSVSRVASLFGPFPPSYPPLNLSLSSSAVGDLVVTATKGYSPLIRSENTLLSLECSDLPVVGPDLRVAFPSPHAANLSWQLLNRRPGLEFDPSLVYLNVMNCSVQQSGEVLNDTSCVTSSVGNLGGVTSHILSVLPFTDYWFQVVGPSTQSSELLVRSPEAGM